MSLTCNPIMRLYRAGWPFRSYPAVDQKSWCSSSTTSKQDRLHGKVAIVTASTKGIGLAIAKKLSLDGAAVMISSRKAANVESALRELKASLPDSQSRLAGLTCHVGAPEDRQRLVQETVQRFGSVDILVSNSAANPFFGAMLDCDEAAWDKIFDVNVKATFLLCKLVVPHMVQRGAGSIVLVSSIGALQPIPMILPYCVSKTALLGLTKALSSELGPQNVRVNSVAPGIIQTDFSATLTSNEAMVKQLLQHLHIKRIGQPQDVSGLVSFLCSDEAAYITGENMVVAGGMQSRL